MEKYEEGGSPEVTYDGWASKDPEPEFVADEERQPKIKLTIEGALRDAYRNAKNAGARPPFVVVRTEVHGDNPISDYKVAIGPTP